MDGEDNLKRIDLKVSINCCEGCKRKVLKALSIKGVLKAEIHPSLPKVTVIGYIHAQIIIKKLAKIGKIAQIWPQETSPSSLSPKTKGVDQETSSKAIEDQTVVTKDCKGNTSSKEANHQSKKDDYSSGGEKSSKQTGESDPINSDVVEDKSTKADRTANHEEAKRDDEGDRHKKDTDHHGNNYETSAPPQATRPTPTLITGIPDQTMMKNYVGNPILLMPNQQANLNARIYYQPMEAANYNVPVNPMSYPIVNACCNRDCHCYSPSERPVMYQMPPVHSQEARGITDYFNDDNTAGCTVM